MSRFDNEVEKFKKLFGYGSFRPSKGKVEVRVKDLDKSREHARKIIEDNGLKLQIGSVCAQLRSFELEVKLCQ
ncbi:hypothetical protein ACP6L2_01080 [Sphingobacterium lactis]|uniref:hypothetical protein n=1 Tax=Sphingobacterium lactis TaxID=797291 RepID=UPI003F8033F2